MIQRRHFTSVISPVVQAQPPTGIGFGCSNLKIDIQSNVLPIVGSSPISVDCTPPVSISPQSPLVVEVGKIALLILWFWCSIGARFCLSSIATIVSNSTQDVQG